MFRTILTTLVLLMGSYAGIYAQQAAFSISDTNPCTADTITITDSSTGTITGWRWIIERAASSDTLTSQGPHMIIPGSGTMLRIRLQVSDGGTTNSTFQDINLRMSPVASIFVFTQNPFCASDGALLSGGFHDKYLWSTGDTTSSLPVRTSGIFWVKVTDPNGCSDYDTVQTVAIPGPTVTITPSGPLEFCEGDSVVLTGGSHTDYFWNGQLSGNTLTAKRSGRYILVATDNTGCGGSDTVDVVVRQAPRPNIANSFFCEGDTLYLSLPGFRSVQWSTGDTTATIPIWKGDTLTALVVDTFGCTGMLGSTIVREIASPEPVITLNGTGVPQTTPFTSYQWAWMDTISGITTPIPGATDMGLTGINYIQHPANQGVIIVTVINSLGCEGQSAYFFIDLPTGIIDNQTSFSIWPQPAEGSVRVQLK